MRTVPRSVLVIALCSTAAAAEPARAGVEVNVLWPFYPGGMFDARVTLPGLTSTGLVVLGARSDYNQSLRDDEGQSFQLYAKLGYRQFFTRGLHAEIVTETGWDHLAHGPGAMFDRSEDGLAVVLWAFAGYQRPLGDRFYANARVGTGYMAYHSNEWPGIVRGPVPAADINLGVTF